MSPELLVGLVVRPLPEKLQVEVGEGGREPIRVLPLHDQPGPVAHLEPVGKALVDTGEGRLEESGRVPADHPPRRRPARRREDPDRLGPRKEDAEDQPPRRTDRLVLEGPEGMKAQDGEGVPVLPADEGEHPGGDGHAHDLHPTRPPRRASRGMAARTGTLAP